MLSSLRSILLARSEQALQLAQESARAALGLDVRNRTGQINFRRAVENVEGGCAEFAFAADDFSRLELPLDDRVAVELEKCSGNILENGQAQQKFWIDRHRLPGGS